MFCMLHVPPASFFLPPFTLSSSLASLLHRWADATPRQTPYWLLAVNSKWASVVWLMHNSSRCKTRLSRTWSRGWISLKRGKPLMRLTWSEWTEWVRGGEDLPSGAAEEHNSLWPCHEGAPLQACRQGEREDLIIPLEQSFIFFNISLLLSQRFSIFFSAKDHLQDYCLGIMWHSQFFHTSAELFERPTWEKCIWKIQHRIGLPITHNI